MERLLVQVSRSVTHLACDLPPICEFINLLRLVDAMFDRLKQVNRTYVSYVFVPCRPSNAEPQPLATSYFYYFPKIPVALQVVSRLWLKHLAANPLCQWNRGHFCHFC